MSRGGGTGKEWGGGHGGAQPKTEAPLLPSGLLQDPHCQAPSEERPREQETQWAGQPAGHRAGQDVPCEPWGRAALGREQGTDRTVSPYLVTVARSPQPNLQRPRQTAPSSVSARAPKAPKSLHTHTGTHSHAALTHTHLHNSHTHLLMRTHTHTLHKLNLAPTYDTHPPTDTHKCSHTRACSHSHTITLNTSIPSHTQLSHLHLHTSIFILTLDTSAPPQTDPHTSAQLTLSP